jgi:hypothetical protein
MSKKKIAYVVVDMPGGWGVAACREHENGYHPVGDYGPYEDETKAQGVVDRLNARAGVSSIRARKIVMSTMHGISRT